MYAVWGCGNRRVVAEAGRGVIWRGEAGDGEYRRLAEEIGAAVREGRAGCAAAAPAGATWTRFLECPVRSRRKASRLWEGVLDLALPFPVEGAAWGVSGVRQGADGGQVGVGTAVRREDLEAAEAAWAAEGWEITHVDSAAAALWEALGGGKESGRRTVAWVEEGSVLTACGEGRRLTGTHFLRAGPGTEGFAALWSRRAAGVLESGDGGRRDVWWCGPAAAGARSELEAAAAGEGVRFAAAADGDGVLVAAMAERAAAGRDAGLKRGERAHPGWAAKEARERRFWMGAAAVAAAAGLLLNYAAAGARAAAVREAGERTAAAAEAIAGRRLPKGQERLLLGRMEDEVAERMAVAGRSLGADGGVAGRLAETLEALADAGAEAKRVSLQGDEATVEMASGDGDGLAAEMERRGWEGVLTGGGAGGTATWRGRKAP